jgi:hypothetical protein
VTMAYRVQKPDGSLGDAVTSKIDNCIAAGSPGAGAGGPR